MVLAKRWMNYAEDKVLACMHRGRSSAAGRMRQASRGVDDMNCQSSTDQLQIVRMANHVDGTRPGRSSEDEELRVNQG